MGTRNLTIVISDGQTKVAQYGRWDGYPEGQGKTALEFLRATDLDVFKAKIDACRFGSADEIDAACAAYSNNGWMTLEQCEAFQQSKFGYLSCDLGAGILERIFGSNGLMLADSSDFAVDSLFCEWAYVVDMDKRTFEVYKGLNNTPLADTERFASLQAPPERLVNDEPDYPVKHVISFNLDKLPTFAEFETAINEALLRDKAGENDLVESTSAPEVESVS